MVIKKLFVVVLFLTVFSCTKEDTKVQFENLQFLKESPIAVPEPSGLSFNSNKTALFTVSDHTSMIYKLTLTGALVGELNYKGNDLEGITVDPVSGDIYVVEERLREVVRLNSDGVELKRFHLDIEENAENSGLEGITFNPDNNHLYILNEKDPGLLIEVDDKGKIVNQTELDFASDYSGIFYERTEQVLWIVSDQSKTINKCELNGEKIVSYRISGAKAEGIVVDNVTKQIYIVLDGANKVQIYSYK